MGLLLEWPLYLDAKDLYLDAKDLYLDAKDLYLFLEILYKTGASQTLPNQPRRKRSLPRR